MDYQKVYSTVFNGITDAIDELQHVQKIITDVPSYKAVVAITEKLQAVQKEAEEMYVEGE